MKKILSVFILTIFLFAWVQAEYNPDKVVSDDEPSTRMVTTSFIDYSDTSKTMHQSWDLDFDGMNDCENDGTCDDSVDYTKAKVYPTSAKFLAAEWHVCTSATDGCNNVMIHNGQLWGMTMMYCEDVYWDKGQEKWSCNAYDEEKVSELKVQIQTMVPEMDMKICTMEYAPVCWNDWVTHGNACMADFDYAYRGECSEYVDMKKFNRFKKQESKLYPIIEKAATKNIENAINSLDKSIETTKLLRIARWVQEERITTYTFLKTLLENVLRTR